MFLSIIIPTYEDIKIFSDCDFIFDNNFCDENSIELIISDDSQTDLVKNLVSNYSHIRYYKHSNTKNPVDNWNYGLDKANGKYVWLLHHDEYIDKLEPVITELIKCDRENIDLFIFDLYIIKNKLLKVFKNSFTKNLFLRFPILLLAFNVLGSPSVLIHLNNGQRYDRNFNYLVDVQFLYNLLKRKTHWHLSKQRIYSNIDDQNNSITRKLLDLRKQHLSELSKMDLSFFKKKILFVLTILRYNL